MNPSVDQAVERAVLRPLPHRLCRKCNPARRSPDPDHCPGCGKRACLRCRDTGFMAEGRAKGQTPCDACGKEGAR